MVPASVFAAATTALCCAWEDGSACKVVKLDCRADTASARLVPPPGVPWVSLIAVRTCDCTVAAPTLLADEKELASRAALIDVETTPV